MNKLFVAAALSIASLTSPVSAITFPSLTTIYVGTGVEDSGGLTNVGTATTIQCSNVSGVATQIRFLVLDEDGVVAGQITRNVNHGANTGVATHGTLYWSEDITISGGVEINRGTINIESLQSGVFCQAYLVDAGASVPSGVPIDLVRVNPHPGTVE